MKFGAHVSGQGGISNAVLNSMNVGGNSMAFFLKSPRKWDSPQYTLEEINKFKENCEKYKYNPLTDILPHGQYFINLANPEEDKNVKSYNSFLDDLKRCEQLGIGLYNFHPGSDLGSDHKTALQKLALNINEAISKTKFVKIVLENMAGHGNLIGSDIQDIADVIEMVEDKSRIGCCIDTCHAFAAGYDLTTEESYNLFWDKFDQVVGFKYLSSIHLNDSKSVLGGNRDLHQRLGLGFLGLECFRLIANDTRLAGKPIILEVPFDKDESVFGEEIKLLEWLVGKSSEDILEKSEELLKKGAKERDEYLKKYEKKQTDKKRSGDVLNMLTKKVKK